ncbi:virulence factor Mce family protein [Mycobacterium branderi]|uniref:Mammalian cell entry protein n=1 Tax=Mycobacterium branderi TaxID=43348 RepID=A0A7I7W2K2_9MYCO|nr:virulence factor Mce family protein [Mycobacterium branderi]MCV7235471.1 virulence factor Mce family protein [Mycobacterium branderi]ORA34354.1 mammalian cell entry protein [Mycobacterium branderi]BBZ11172.1 Mce family protein Mce1D [Mycobacterium branderi]
MSTVFDIRNLRLPKLSRAAVIIGSLVIVLALVAGYVGIQLFKKLTNNTVVAYFPEANALYRGDEVRIMGVPVGSIDKIEPAGDKMKVTFHYANKYKVPANASAEILNPTLVASRYIQLDPPYKGGPVLGDNAVIPIERTQVPTEWDQLRNTVTNIISKLGPTKEQPKGPFGDIIESFANGLAGKGKKINTTLDALSRSLNALNEGRGDFFAVVRSLALFVNALHEDDQKFVALNKNLAQFTDSLAGSDRDLANAIQQFDSLLTTLRPFLAKNREVLAHDVNNLASATNTLLQPDPLNGLETVLHVAPTALANLNQIYHPSIGAVVGQPVSILGGIGFANPMQLICSTIQAFSRAGYQESAELCAQYLAPILDAIKFNYIPFGLNFFSTAATLPKEVAYSEPRLQPPPGYKDTTVPGIWVPDTPTSHRNTQPGWIVAPGMQGTQVGPITEGLLTPESLAELMGGPNIEPVQSQYQTPPGPPNAYNEEPGPLPFVGVPGNPQPIPPPPPGPEVVPGPVAPTPAPVSGPVSPQVPGPGGPPLPAEAASSTGGGS